MPGDLWKPRYLAGSLFMGQYLLYSQGMYIAGIPVGLLVDSKGPRPGVLLGGLSLGSGYLILQRGTP